MIAARRQIAAGENGKPAALGAAGWLSLAAAPAFAVMALLAGVEGDSAGMMCVAAHGQSPMNGMVPMYLLMGLFHSAPWLKLLSSQR
jgi:hypothetical protein